MKKNNNPQLEELLIAMLAYQQESLKILQAIYQSTVSSETIVRKDASDIKRELKVSDSTLYRWRVKGYIKYEKIRGKIYYFVNTLRNQEK